MEELDIDFVASGADPALAQQLTGHIEESYPELAPLLATPCDFVIYHKELRA